jgi:hypothetical protein
MIIFGKKRRIISKVEMEETQTHNHTQSAISNT